MELNCYPDVGALTAAAARYIAERARECVAHRDAFTLVLSGGSTPKPLYEILSSADYRDLIPWTETHIFWGDERCVPPDHPDSNYGMAYESLLKRTDIPGAHIHRIPGEVDPPESAAEAYERDLRNFFHFDSPGGPSPKFRQTGPAFPSFDLVLLGLGEDGHTASLFPEDPALHESDRWVAAVKGLRAKPAIPRITLTLPVLNEARCVLFLVSGEAKRPIVEAMRNDIGSAEAIFPAARVKPKGRLLWFYA